MIKIFVLTIALAVTPAQYTPPQKSTMPPPAPQHSHRLFEDAWQQRLHQQPSSSYQSNPTEHKHANRTQEKALPLPSETKPVEEN